MFPIILQQEIKYWIRQPQVYVYAGVLFGAAFLTMAGTAQAFDAHTDASEITSRLNSPISISRLTNRFTFLLLVLLPAIAGMSIYRDFKNNAHALLYAYPFKKPAYLAAKFLSAYLVAIAVASAIGIGFLVGESLPTVNPALVPSTHLMPYIREYLFFVMPNLLFYGAIIFTVVALSRNLYAGFITVLLVLMVQLLTGVLLKNLDNFYLAALLDPLGGTAVGYMTRYWTNAESDAMFIPFRGVIVHNRLLWLSISLLFLGASYRYFNFSQNASGFLRREKPPERVVKNNFGSINKVHLTQVAFDHSFFRYLKTTWALSRLEFRYIFTSWSFLGLVAGGSLTVGIILLAMNPQYAGKVLPVTWQMLRFPTLFFAGVINLLTFLYAGMLAHRTRMARMDQLVDCTPVPNWVFVFSHFFALLKMQGLLLSIIALGGMAVQVFNGFTDIQVGHYVVELYVLNFIHYAIWAMAAVFVQNLLSNPFLGVFTLISLMIGVKSAESVGIHSELLRFNETPGGMEPWSWSDLDGYGADLARYLAYKGYWLVCGFIMLFAAVAFRFRGLPGAFGDRLRIAGARIRGWTGVAILVLLPVWLVTGIWVHHQEKASRSAIFSTAVQEHWAAENEKRFKRFENTVQPRFSAVRLEVDLYPETRDFKARGIYHLVNLSSRNIDTLLVAFGYAERTKYDLDQPYEVLIRDTFIKTDVLVLRQSLLPGDSLKLTFEVKNPPNTLFQNNARIRKNGTFLRHTVFPDLGYRPVELTGITKRKKYGLAPKGGAALPMPEDTAALAAYANYRNQEDWIDLEVVVSTSADQTAVAPGNLQKQWTANGRSYFHYKSGVKIKRRFTIQSGQYHVARTLWRTAPLEVYHHPAHTWNVDRILRGFKAALDYCSTHYSPYIHTEARVVEFPVKDGTYATLQANTMPASELYFILDVREQSAAFDLPFYVAAHETAHQWWGNRIEPARALGAKMLTEGMAEYTTLKVVEKEYGRARLREFLKQDMDLYLRGRSGESGEEAPLLYTRPDQEYINYRKASLVFYALSDYIGEDRFNAALKSFQTRFAEPARPLAHPYPRSVDLLHEIRKQTPDTLQYLIRDLFETITLYENRIEDVKVTPLADGRFQVDLEFTASKYRADGKGTRRYTGWDQANGRQDSLSYQNSGADPPLYSLPLNDYIEIGIFGKKTVNGSAEETELYLKKHKVTGIHNKVRIIVDRAPQEAGIDPYCKLIDTRVTDNRKKVTVQ